MDVFKIFKRIACFQELSDEEICVLIKFSTIRVLQKKEKLAEPGLPFNHLFIITEGLLRFFFDDEKGVERNLFLPSENEAVIMGSPESYSSENVTKFTIEAIIETRIFIFDKNAFEEAAFQHKGIYSVYLTSLKRIINVLAERTEQFCATSPHSRYENFLGNRSFTSQNANRKYIANFLGITPNSLSRITARVHKKRNERKK